MPATKVSSLLWVCYLGACEQDSSAWLACFGERVLLFQVSWQDTKLVVFADLLPTEPLSFPASKTCPMDCIKFGCINLMRLIYCFFFFLSLSFLASTEINFLMYLFVLDVVESSVPEHSLKLATAFLLSLSHVLVGLTVLKAIAVIKYSMGPEPLRVGTEISLSI